MKTNFKIILFCALYLSANLIEAQAQAPVRIDPTLKSNHTNVPSVQAEKAYFYQVVKNDPLNARIYQLENGLTVYMSVYKDAPRIQTLIAVRAGSKNDPNNATGLAHYLEHMLFKGTDQFGTKDFTKEEPLLEEIEYNYELYRRNTNENERRKIYHKIDSISGVAAKYAIANEYDKMLSSMGAQATNAHTTSEETVYENDIPSNQLEKWLTIEAERFRTPVMRLFHTELEAVYEEKNRGLDNDINKMWEALYAGIWQKHPYGTQTTIGTIEHLKNPSISEIKKYYDTYYVPNNMAICLSGDFDPDATIKMIAEKFGSYESKELPKFEVAKEEPINKPVIKEVIGPDAEMLMIGFRFGGAETAAADMISLISSILSNGKAGLIDLNLNQKQKVLFAEAGEIIQKDYSAHILIGQPKEGQKLEDLKSLLLSQIDAIKKGDFQDWLLQAIITDLKLKKTKEYEQNAYRANAFVNAFTLGLPWESYVNKINRLSKITKKDIVAFAKKNYTANNYVVVYKRTGEDKSVQKVIKPEITPVSVNRDDQSDFLKKTENSSIDDIEPVFIDYANDIKTLNLKNNISVLYKKNEENNLFELYYISEMGSNNNPKLNIAVNYLPFLGTSKYSPAQIQQEFYKLGCSFNVSSSEEQTYVSLTGLNENFEKALSLFETILSDAQPNKEPLSNLVSDILKNRSDEKLNKEVIKKAMVQYGKYGTKSPFTNILSEQELKALSGEELVGIIKELNSFEHHILYYGPSANEELITTLNKNHKTPETLKSIPAAINFERVETDNNVYLVDYDMKQAEIVMLSKSTSFDKSKVPTITLYNAYFGGNMGSIVFQELRESKALAYSVYAYYQTPSKKSNPNYMISYIGSQADKMADAMAGMTDLLNNMPKSDMLLNTSKESVLQNIRTERITKSSILFNYEAAKKIGINYDIRKDIFAQIPAMTFNDIKLFQEQTIKNKTFNYLVLGKKENLDLKMLEKYGKIKTLSLQDIFGY
jgi:predicted Zn-dependent peptidase